MASPTDSQGNPPPIENGPTEKEINERIAKQDRKEEKGK